MFSTLSYTTIGDEYDKKLPMPDRFRGRQMVTNPSRRGMTPDVFFDRKLPALSVAVLGGKYVDPGTRDKQQRLQESKKRITKEGFRYTSPSKKSSGLGGYYGCFCEKAPPKHETEYVVPHKGETTDKAPPQPRNITTRPTKKGTYGFAGTTISKGDEYRYISDPYDPPQRRSEQKETPTKKLIGAAFKASCRRIDFFDSQPNVAASKIYSLDRALPARKTEAPKKEAAIAVPFRPPSPSKSGLAGTLSKFPDYRADPYEAKEKAQREARDKNRPPVIWKPTSASKSLPVRSIAFTPAALAD